VSFATGSVLLREALFHVKVKNLQHGQAVRLVTVPFDRQRVSSEF
jgi:hypothetical protein